MLFPSEDEYRGWMERAGFTDLRRVHVAPDWWRAEWDPYARRDRRRSSRAAGAAPIALGPPRDGERAGERLGPARLARFARRLAGRRGVHPGRRVVQPARAAAAPPGAPLTRAARGQRARAAQRAS